MWVTSGKSDSAERFRSFAPDDLLYEFDGPRIFTLKDAEDELNLAYWSDEHADLWRYVVVPTTSRILNALKEGTISVFDALDQPRCWVCDVNRDNELVSCNRVEFDAIPRDCLPAPGTMLLPSLEPLLTLRAVGAEVVPGRIPGSVIRTCVEGVQRTFKVLSEYVLGAQPQAGRPDEFLRRLFDLPTQRFALGSFEISFRMPIEEPNLFTANGEESPEKQTLDEVGALLNKALKWLASSAGAEGLLEPSEESAVLLRALKGLTPSSQGSIEQLELSGQLVGPSTKPIVLERSARKRVNSAIRNQSLEPQLIDLEGRIRELDKDRLSFELREIHGTVQVQRFVFDEELLEDVFEAFQEDARVHVAGHTFPVKNVAYALAMSRPRSNQPGDGTISE